MKRTSEDPETTESVKSGEVETENPDKLRPIKCGSETIDKEEHVGICETSVKTGTLTTDDSIKKKRKSKKISKEHILAYEEYIRATEAYELALEQHVRQLERCLAVNEKILRITGTAK